MLVQLTNSTTQGKGIWLKKIFLTLVKLCCLTSHLSKTNHFVAHSLELRWHYLLVLFFGQQAHAQFVFLSAMIPQSLQYSYCHSAVGSPSEHEGHWALEWWPGRQYYSMQNVEWSSGEWKCVLFLFVSRAWINEKKFKSFPIARSIVIPLQRRLRLRLHVQ